MDLRKSFSTAPLPCVFHLLFWEAEAEKHFLTATNTTVQSINIEVQINQFVII